ncbi:MAG: lipoate--protein ligase family protein [Gammaproteobacteria bacterium]|nr:lipoate--protein ligase family protein [Gammaproteobacteria bacterium]
MHAKPSTSWRLLDTGTRHAAENFAMNRAILESHQQGSSPHTLRFLGFFPAALIGFHQDVEQELNLDYIRANNIEVQRRLSGGGAIYMDELQFGWELYLNRKALASGDMAAIAKRICDTVARALQGLGVDAHFRPRNDIEVDGRKISGTGGYFDGDSFLYQGSLLVDFDMERMMRVLRIPAEKINHKSISDARQRIITLRELLADKVPDLGQVKSAIAQAIAEEFAIEWEATDSLNPAEEAIFHQALEEIDSDEWIYQHNRPVSEAPLIEDIYKAPGGLIRTTVIVDALKQRIKQLWITGDFFVIPSRLVVDLEASLRNTAITDLEKNVQAFFAQAEIEMLMLKAEDFIAAISQALAKSQ